MISAICTASVPLLPPFRRQRRRPVADRGAVLDHALFHRLLGRDPGIQLNYIGAAAVTLAVLGIERLPLAIAIAVLALACHLAGWFLFPPDQALVLEESWFLDQLYANSAISIMAIIFLIVFYGFRLAILPSSGSTRCCTR